MIVILIALRSVYKEPYPPKNEKDKWQFLVGFPSENTNTHPPIELFSSKIQVDLPHTLNKENSAFWYERKMIIPKDTIWQIKADDGAQLWVDGERINNLWCNYFYIKGSKDPGNVIIRVLNNAVNGGLKKVEGFPATYISTIKKLSSPFQLNSFGKLAQQTNSSTIRARQKGVLNFSAWGDSQGGWDTFMLLTQFLQQEKYDFTIGLGDLTSNGCDASEWQKLARGLQSLSQQQQLFLVPGNHDYDGNYDDLYADNFMEFQKFHKQKNSYFSFGNELAVFLVLDPNKNFPLAIDKSQEKWAVNVMESDAWKKARWRFVLCHQVAFGCGWPGYSGDQFLRNFFTAYAEKNKIDFVLSGHIHDYERVHKQYGSHTTTFLISGGAGGGLEPIENDITHNMEKVVKKHHYLDFKLTEHTACIKTFDLNQHLIDSINIQK
ncbi:MAG TPA: metallophosphoesterase [Saprospiraceae bacterium]|nr:metallophosphoesterase [Saprospiraceae bacterium]